MAQKDVILQVSRIKPDHTDEVESVYETIRDEKEEARIALDETDVYAESAFLHRTDHGDYLIVHVECDDWDRVQELYEESDHELDELHREVLGDAVDEEDWKNCLLTPEFHIVVD